jgi:hypothetical protein
MSGRGIFDVVGGISCIALGIFNPEFRPIGFVSAAIYRKDGRIPRWVGTTFYVCVGLFLIFLGFNRH